VRDTFDLAEGGCDEIISCILEDAFLTSDGLGYVGVEDTILAYTYAIS
jgi:hypothetical protein